jgi:hypothetical protein
MSEPHEALAVFEDGATGNRFIPYQTSKGVELDCAFDGEQPWFTQADLAAIFGVSVPTIINHIQSFMDDGELDDSTTRYFEVVRREGNRQVRRQITHYGLDVAFYVGYRVNSGEGKLFRRWATKMLVQLATKGFVVHERRLKGGETAERIRELRQAIADIRSEEANLYAELRAICAMCQDYDPDSDAARKFYQHMQAKIFYAVVSMTPAQMIAHRANAQQPNMGLQSWKGDRVLSSDVTTGKNYLAPREVDELNRLTSILLDIFEDQLDIGRLTLMSAAASLLDEQLKGLGRAVLDRVGPPTKTAADERAKEQYRIFNEQRRLKEAERYDGEIAALKSEAKKLPNRLGGRKRAPRTRQKK